MNRNFFRYLVTGTNGCIANVISTPFAYLSPCIPLLKLCFLILVEHYDHEMNDNYPFVFSYNCSGVSFILRSFCWSTSVRIFWGRCKWWKWVSALCISSKNKALKRSSEFPDWQATAEPSVGLLIFPCECWNYLAGPTALSQRIRSQVWELDSTRTCFIMFKLHKGRILDKILGEILHV